MITCMMDQTRKISIEWSIKGYHAFHIRPHLDIELIVEPEENNRYDSNAMKVMMPSLNNIPSSMYGDEIQQGRGRRALSVREIAGRQIGRVPANLCRAFKTILSEQFATKITCKYNGDVGQSVISPVHQRFRHATPNERFARPGGGAELQCVYHIRIKKRCFEQAMHVFEDMVPREELDLRLSA